MKSIKCPSCTLVQWADNQNCKRCGSALGYEASSNVNPTPYQYRHNPYDAPADGKLRTGLALASMIVGIVAFPTMFLLIGVLLAPVAIVLGILALRKANKYPQVYGGKGFAVAGIAVASLVCVFVPIIAAVAIPNLLAARRAANEGTAINIVQKLAVAQEAYVEMDSDGECGELTDLVAKNLIPSYMAAGKRKGYTFTAQGNIVDVNGCEIQATPESKSEGTRSFYYSSSDNILRVAIDGFPADHNDPPVESTRASY